jgi:hypothetical protein
MVQNAKAPATILIASVVLVIEFILLFVTGYLDLPLLQGALVLLLAVILMLGSRAGWILLLIGTIWDVVVRFSGEQPLWMLSLDGLLLFTLLVPSSIRFVWTDRPPRRFIWPRLPDGFSALPSTVTQVGRLPYSSLAWRCGFVLLLLLIPSGMIQEWQEGSGRNSTLAEVLEVLTDALFSVTLIAFLVILCVWVYSSLGMRSRRE